MPELTFDEADLVRRLVNRDQSALSELYQQFGGLVYSIALRVVQNSSMAEEVAQDTFLRAVRQDRIVSERSWLFAVATNLVRDEARKDIRRRRRLEGLREQARADEVVDPEPLSIERAQESAMARRALDELTERDREALLMREEGLDYTEIAEALELSVGSVGTTLARARRRLVEAFESLQGKGSEARGTHAAS